MTKLRTWQTAQSAYGFVFKHQSEFWRLAILPMAIFCAVFVVVYSTIGMEFANSDLGEGLARLLLTILVLPFIVAWHEIKQVPSPLLQSFVLDPSSIPF